MAYHARVDGFFNAERAQVEGRDVPRNYAVDFEPKEDESRPWLHLDIEVVDGVPTCREARLTQSAHGREVRRADFEDISLEEIILWATQTVSQPIVSQAHDEESNRTVWRLDPTGLDVYRKDVQKVRRESYRRGPTDEQLRAAAELYASVGGAPTQAVAERFGIKHRTASLWIKRAREKGFFK